MRIGPALSVCAPRKSGGAAPAFDLTSLAWTLLTSDNYGGSPWAGQASAGTSAGVSLTEGVTPPSAGTAVSTFTPAVFDGVDDLLSSGTALSSLISASAYTVFAVFNASAAAAAGTVYNNPAIFSDQGGGYWGLHFASNGVTMYHDDGGAKERTAACSTGGWHVAIGRLRAGQLGVSLDGAPFSTVGEIAAGNVNALGLPQTVRMGINYSVTYWGGSILKAGIAATGFTDSECASLYTALKAKYPAAGLP